MSDQVLNNEIILNKYIELMKELKRRDEVLLLLLEGKASLKYQITQFEGMFLQLRRILEIIAMSPILINEDQFRTISKKPEYEWRIKNIMNQLEELNTDYFPKPITIINNQGKPDKFIDRKNGYLTKDDLISAYDKCSDILHTTNPLRRPNTIKFDKEREFISSTRNKIRLLLNPHIIKSIIDDGFFYIVMHHTENGYPFGNYFCRNSISK